MKKKFLVSLIVVCVLLPAVLSAAIADLSIGATAMYNVTGDEVVAQFNDGDFSGLTDISNYTFGADLRVKFLLAEVDVIGMYTPPEDSSSNHELSVLTTGGISLDLLGLARLGFGMGPRFRVLIDKDGNAFVYASDNTSIENWNNFGDAFIKSPVSYRATLDFNLGSIMLGVNYTVDSTYTFENYSEIDRLFKADTNSGKFGVSLLFSLL
ncbi:hypothetical protein SpiGrapes_1196 [Sphaerochaeta pleomorpha str. Grapes]|uniref:Outer membrane protein beta-barrel domain-containing protein n=1 Tax=Sphaerochaeta pleomorpha (strain ATCC BAA-1885 / DSM 22778 / Grapes) TaxID=158190 RepID=G8QSQ2_SPHPG|nr:hypothetical protein [Sphaerochaeta pleomorpha]AEV29013.1 hypothetical protein SpiGrapes_1196 [Sphaerochaeta pleomorpha str. Grapes]